MNPCSVRLHDTCLALPPEPSRLHPPHPPPLTAIALPNRTPLPFILSARPDQSRAGLSPPLLLLPHQLSFLTFWRAAFLPAPSPDEGDFSAPPGKRSRPLPLLRGTFPLPGRGALMLDPPRPAPTLSSPAPYNSNQQQDGGAGKVGIPPS